MSLHTQLRLSKDRQSAIRYFKFIRAKYKDNYIPTIQDQDEFLDSIQRISDYIPEKDSEDD